MLKLGPPMILSPASEVLRGLEEIPEIPGEWLEIIRRETARLHRVIAGEKSEEEAQAERDRENEWFHQRYGCVFDRPE